MPSKLSESIQATIQAIDKELASVMDLIPPEGLPPTIPMAQPLPFVTEQQVQDWLDRMAKRLQKVNQALGREKPQFFDKEKVKQVKSTGFPDTARELLAYIFGGACKVLQSLKKPDFNAATEAVVAWLPSLKGHAARIARLEGLDKGLPDPGFLANYLMQLFIESTKDSNDFNVGQGATDLLGKGDGSSVIVAGMVYFSVAAKILVQGQSFAQKGNTELKKIIIDDVKNPVGIRNALLEIYGSRLPFGETSIEDEVAGLHVPEFSSGLWESAEGGRRKHGNGFRAPGRFSAW